MQRCIDNCISISSAPSYGRRSLTRRSIARSISERKATSRRNLSAWSIVQGKILLLYLIIYLTINYYRSHLLEKHHLSRLFLKLSNLRVHVPTVCPEIDTAGDAVNQSLIPLRIPTTHGTSMTALLPVTDTVAIGDIFSEAL